MEELKRLSYNHLAVGMRIGRVLASLTKILVFPRKGDFGANSNQHIYLQALSRERESKEEKHQRISNLIGVDNRRNHHSRMEKQKQHPTGDKMTPEERKEELTKCLLSQYRLCAAGTIGGAGFSVLRSQSARPTAWPMLGGAVRKLFVCTFHRLLRDMIV